MDVLQQVLWPAISTAWPWLLLVAGVSLLRALWRMPRVKGWWGEQMVRRWLAQDLQPPHYRVLHNVTLRLADGSSTQIDHVVLSVFGLFVVETKHMQGWIYGKPHEQTWMQKIYRSHCSFPNPLRQNWRHLMALQEVLQLPAQVVHSVIIFTGESEFKSRMPENVTQGRAGVRYIAAQQQVVWTVEQVDQLHQQLREQRLPPTLETHRAHVQHVQQRHATKVSPSPRAPVQRRPVAQRVLHSDVTAEAQSMETADAAEESLKHAVERPSLAAAATHCPECHTELALRNTQLPEGAMRWFLRCGRFPHCRFVQPLSYDWQPQPAEAAAAAQP